MSSALGEVGDVKTYVTGFEVSPTESCSVLEVFRANSKSSYNFELTARDL